MNPTRIFVIFVVIMVGLLFFQKGMVDKERNVNGKMFDGSVKNFINVITRRNPTSINISDVPLSTIDIPDFSKENYTEFMYKRLVKDLSKFTSNQQKLKGKCKETKYIWNTTDKFLKDEMNQVTKIVIDNLNKQCKFNFNYSGYGDIKIKEDEKGNKQFNYELFVWDKKNYFQVKLDVNLIKYVRKDYILPKKRSNNKNLIFPYYNIGTPSKEQLIPTPMNVIPTGNDVISTSGIDYPVPSPVEYLYINSISIENSTLIINSQNRKNDVQTCGGFADGSESFSYIKGDSDPYIEPAVIRNKWSRLPNQPYCVNTWPCTPKANDWDSLGIYQPDVKDTSECPGETWAAQYVYPQPSYNPTIATLPRNCGENYWLFDQTNGSGASASSASQPPP